MGFFWTSQLEDAVSNSTISGPLQVRVSLMSRAPYLSQEDGQNDVLRAVTTLADLLTKPGWEEVSDDLYTSQLNTSCTLLVQGQNTFVTYGTSPTQPGYTLTPTNLFTLEGATPVEAIVLSVPGTAIGIASSDEYVLFATDTPFRSRGRTVFRDGDGFSGQLDSLTETYWWFGWSVSGGVFNALAEGPVVLQLGAPVFESSRLQHVWMFPQRVNFIANPSFEYTAGFWQSNKGALTQSTDTTGNPPSPTVGYVSGTAPVSALPLHTPSERLYVRSAKFFPKDRTLTFQLMARGRGIVRVAVAAYTRDYTEHDADWGLRDDLLFQEWEITDDHYTKLQGIRTISDTAYEASLLIEVRGFTDNGTYQHPYIYIDQCIVEEGSLIEWNYFDGDETYGAEGDYSWYGLDSDDKVGKSYSLWYNNMRDINGRLFARRLDDTNLYTSQDEQLDSMLSEWVPTGVTIVPHWGALATDDTLLRPDDKGATVLPVELWPEQVQTFDLFQVVDASSTGITLRVVGEGGHPISRAFVKSGTSIIPATISMRPWEDPAKRSYEIDALKAQLFDLSVAQEVTISWSSVPAFGSNILYIERGAERSPQSFIVYELLSSASAGFGSGVMETFAVEVMSSPRTTLIAASGTANNASVAYGALAQTASSVAQVNAASPAQQASTETAAATGSAFGALVQTAFLFFAQDAAAVGSASTASAVAQTLAGAGDATSSMPAAIESIGVAPSTATGLGQANSPSVARDDAPNPVTSLTGSYSGNGFTWDAIAAWSLPVDPDLLNVQVRWTINSVVGAWIDLAPTATGHTQAATSGTTHTVEVRTVDTYGQTSTITSYALGSSPLDAVPTLTVTQSTTRFDQAIVTWTHPSGNGRSGYRVSLGTGETVTLSSSATSHTFSDASQNVAVLPGNPIIVSATVIPLDTVGFNREGRPRSNSTTMTYSNPTLSVASSTYSQVNLSWTAVTGTETYEVQRAIGNGAFFTIQTGLTTTTYSAAVSQDTNYRFQVLAKSGNLSRISNEVRPSIGHPSSTYTQPWSASNSSVNLYLNNPQGVNVPSNVAVSTMSVNLVANAGFTSLLTFNQRDAFYVAGGAMSFAIRGTNQSGQLVSKPLPWVETFSYTTSLPGLSGIQVVGTGWTTSATGTQRVTGTISLSGTETVTVSEVPNSFW